MYSKFALRSSFYRYIEITVITNKLLWYLKIRNNIVLLHSTKFRGKKTKVVFTTGNHKTFDIQNNY